jgi:hypothetical protein
MIRGGNGNRAERQEGRKAKSKAERIKPIRKP